MLHDHLGIPNLSGFNPLLGPQHDPSLTRFLPTSDAYSTSLRRAFFHAVHELGFGLDDFAEGTYAWVSGPTFESPAEGRFLRAAGADVVGMSTVPEVLAAKEEGLEVIALSLVTNFVIIPDTYRSIKAEVKTEVLSISFSPSLRKTHLSVSVIRLARREDRRGPTPTGCLSRGDPRHRLEEGSSHWCSCRTADPEDLHIEFTSKLIPKYLGFVVFSPDPSGLTGATALDLTKN